jgi:hypothetical protein
MPLKTVNEAGLAAQTLINNVTAWRMQNLPNMANTNNGPKTRLEMLTVQSQAQSYLDLLAAVKNGSGWSGLSADVKSDVAELVEDLTLGLQHLSQKLDPATMFTAMTDAEKGAALQHARLTNDDVSLAVVKLTGAYRANGPKP